MTRDAGSVHIREPWRHHRDLPARVSLGKVLSDARGSTKNYQDLKHDLESIYPDPDAGMSDWRDILFLGSCWLPV